jgi:hypothetical protein
MPGIQRLLTIVAGAFLFATIVFALMAAPGFLADEASTVPVAKVTPEVRR